MTMGMPDRDRWKEDPRAGRVAPSPDAGKSNLSIGRILLLVCLLLLAYWLGLRQGLFAPLRPAHSIATPATNRAADLPGLACSDAFPAAGTMFAGPQWPADAPIRSEATFVNRTPVDRVVDLMRGERLLASVAVPAHADAVVALPVGVLDWRLRAGAAWCANGWRFVREQRTTISPPIEIVASSRLTVEIAPDADHPTGFSLRTRDAPVVATAAAPAPSADSVQSSGDVLRLPRSADGHYFVDGTLDDEPVRFMIDTGATSIAVPVTLARRLGYYQGREVAVQTAGGQTTGSEFRVRRLRFGPFVAEDVTVVALMNLETPLLGMSLLQSVELRQTAEGLELRRAR
jgi:aspartyl protease family protein